jgi:hypothetical protein
VEEPSTEWEWEVVRRVLAAEDEEMAITAVMQKFLAAGNPQPLIDMGSSRRPIPPLARRYIALMFDESTQSNEPGPTYFDITRRERTVTDETRRRLEWIEAGKAALDNNQDPDWMFWLTLANALRVGHPSALPNGSPLPTTPIMIKIKFRDQRHRPKDPAVAVNRAVLHTMVGRAIKDGAPTTEKAIERVATENGVSVDVVTKAYYGAG